MKESNLVDDTAILAQICEQCNLSPQDIEDAYPCTPVQSGMMVDSALYVHTIVHKVDSSVDLNQLSHALDQVVAMNHVLRTRIVDCDGTGLLQAVVRKGEPVLQSEERDFEYFLKWNNSLSTELGTPLVRFAIVTGGDGTRLITTMHHVIFDLHVLESLIEDTWSVYQGISPPERPPFKNFVNHCNSIDPKEATAFWKKHFAGGASTFPPVPAGHQPIAREIITREISISQQKTQTTPSMALMPAYIEAAWALTVSDYTNNDSVAFGYILSGRGAGMPGGAETTFGPTITSVPVQVDIRRSMTTHQLVKERVASRRELSTSSFLQFGLANIRNVNEATRNAANFQSALSIVHRSHMKGLGTSGLILDKAFTEEPPKPHGLLLICTPGEKHVHIKTLFDPEVLEPEQVHRILRQLDHRLRQLITSAPSTPLKRLTCLNFGDTLETMDWNSRRFPTEPMKDCLHSRIAARATDQPNDLAVTSWDGEATYAELMTMVDNLAPEILARHGDIAAEEPVCIMIGRSLSLTVALLAVMRVGGICVPIDPNLPKARKEAIITQCQARLILTPYESPREIYEYRNNCMLLPVVPDRHANAAKTAELPPDDAPASRAAFMIFTSGSTGHPKGVVLEHKSYVSSLKAWTDVVGWKRGARVLQYSTPSFDACAGEIMGTFQAGACLCIPSDLDRESGLGDYIRSNSVNYVGLTPTTLRSLSPQDVLPALKSVASAGEPITRKVFETWSDKVHLVNAWGPTEASIVASVGDLTPDTRYPDTIGTPLGCALWIVDPEDMNRLLPIGSVGEMLIDGPGVAREYYLAPELTKASFVKPPSFLPKRGNGLDSSRLYRTGDLARYNADGTICFHGRRDNQVKIRGQRFELGEVESALASHQSISDVIVTTYQKGSGSVIKDVVVVFTFSSHPKQQVVDVSESKSEVTRIALDKSSRQQLRLIQDFAKDRFPTYMVPTVWLVVRELPHTPSKKVDRVKIKAWLATIDMSAVRESSQTTVSQQNQGYRTLTPPTTPAEVILQQTWSNVLHIDSKKIGRESSFMRLGGDSITAMQVATRCRRKGFQIAVADLLRKSTLAESATEIQPIRNTLPVIIPTMNAAEESQLHPLSPVQKFLFEGNGPASHNQFNQAFLLDISPSMGIEVSPSRIKRALERIVAHHPMLRCRFFHGQDAKGKVTLEQRIAPLQNQGGQSTWAFRFHPNISSNEDLWNVVSTSQASLNIFDGPVFSADVIITPQGQTSLFLVAHHLVIDLVSWRILWEDLEAILKDESCILPQSFPFLLWVQGQRDMQKGDMTSSTSWPKADYRFWKMEGLKPKVKDMLRLQHTLSQKQTEQIMGESCNTPFSTTPVILLLGAVVSSFLRVFPDRGTPALYNESHGRDTDATNESAGLSRTIGWFTTLFPLLLRTLSTGSRIEDIVMAIKDEYHYASKGCIDEFASQVLLEPTPSSFKRNDIELALNFAGRMQQVTHKDSLLRLRTDGPPVHLENVTGECESVGLLSFYAYIDEDEKLTLTLDYNSHMAHQDRIVRWMKEELGNCFTEMMSALSARSFNLTASDLPLLNMSSGPASVEYLHSQLEDLGVAHDNVESIYPCTATQDGILFSQLNGYDYHNRFVARLTSSEGDVDMTRTADAWKGACQAHPILRTIFTTGLSDQSAFQQIVLKKCQPFVSVREMPTDGSTISAVVASQEKMPLNSKQPPHKLTLYRESASVIHAVVDVSHVLADAKTFQDLFHTIGLAYSKTVGGGTPVVAPGRPFSDYVEWLRGQQEEASKYWRNYLQGVKPCVFPRDPAATVDYEARGPVVPFHDGQRLSRFCQEQAVTHAMFMQAAWALVLRKYTGNSTVCFGSVRSDQEVLPSNGGSADILGPLISMLPCRFDMQHLDSVTIRDVLETARNDSVRSMSYSGCYLAELHDELGLRDSPLFDTIMTIQRAWSNDLGDGSGHLSI
ncbi:hypothetical protein DER45DRAFT_380302 [Fusarium avenaceum]|nr:hypothetical protein DER45DRAFT_380302 [Fusarium avenaceum]